MSERQDNHLESDAVEVDFAALSTASSLDRFLDHSVQLSRKCSSVTEAYLGVLSGTRRQDNEQEIVLSFGNTAVQLGSAVRRACELLGDVAVLQGDAALAEPLAQYDEVPGCKEASHLMALLGLQLVLMERWLFGKPLLQGDRMRLKIAANVASSGLLPPLARLCDIGAATVIQQQGQQQQLRLECQRIVQVLIQLASGLLVSWPGKWFSGRTLAPVLPSLLRLLVSALSNSRSSKWLDGGLATFVAVAVLPRLIFKIHTELEAVEDAVTEGQLDSLHSLPSETKDILQSHAVQHLLLLGIASLVEQLHEHKQSAGEDSASSSTQQRQQRQQVAAAHVELYHAVGLCDCFVLSHDMSDSTSPPDVLIGLIDASTTVLSCQEAMQRHSRINSNSINSSNRRSPQQQQQEMLVQPKVCYALLSVAVEILELHPDDCTTAAAMVDWIANLLLLLESQLSVATAAPRLSSSVLAAYHNAAEVRDYMQRSFEVVLLQLVPAVTQSLRNAAGGAGSNKDASSSNEDASSSNEDASSSNEDTSSSNEDASSSNEDASSSNSGSRQTVCRESLARLLQRIVSNRWTPATAILTAYQQNPVTTLSSLEAGVRLLATDAAIVVDLRAMMSQQTAISAEPEQQQQRQQQKSISLGISLLKCCKRLWSCDRDWQLIGLATMVLEASLLGAAAAAGISCPPASLTAVQASMRTQALVFVGRCLLVVADFVHAQLSTSSTSDQLLDLLPPDLWLDIGTTLPLLTEAVQLLQQQSAASISIGSTSAVAEKVATAVQTLQQQAASLQDSLVAAQGPWQELLQQPLPQTEEVPGSPGTFELPGGHASANLALALLKLGFGASGEVAQQLGDLAAAVCAAVPVPCCCNNPGCDNLTRFSDLELVSGKSCVCARCEVARYCGRECQVAHWLQHKAACKRIKASKQA